MPQVLGSMSLKLVCKVKNNCFRAMTAYRLCMEDPFLIMQLEKIKKSPENSGDALRWRSVLGRLREGGCRERDRET